MARYQCRACGFDDRAAWSGELVCPRCGSTTAVRVAIASEEFTKADIAVLTAASVPESFKAFDTELTSVPSPPASKSVAAVSGHFDGAPDNAPEV